MVNGQLLTARTQHLRLHVAGQTHDVGNYLQNNSHHSATKTDPKAAN